MVTKPERALQAGTIKQQFIQMFLFTYQKKRMTESYPPFMAVQ